MSYQYLLADNDMTLMDFRRAERLAFMELTEAYQLPAPEALYARYHQINTEVWQAYERGELTQEELKLLRFTRLLAEAGLGSPSGAEASAVYEENLSRHGEPLPGAVEFLTRMKQAGIRIALVTNGIAAIQRGRLRRCGFAQLLDSVIISGEEGVSKPDPRLVDRALESLGCQDRRRAVMLGDSLSADVAAAYHAGVDCIWLNPEGKTDPRARWSARTLEEAAAIVLGGRSKGEEPCIRP